MVFVLHQQLPKKLGELAKTAIVDAKQQYQKLLDKPNSCYRKKSKTLVRGYFHRAFIYCQLKQYKKVLDPIVIRLLVAILIMRVCICSRERHYWF